MVWARSFLVAAACMSMMTGCRDRDDDDSAVVVDQGPAPVPDPEPEPTPGPEPPPDPDPPPDPQPDPEPPQGWFQQNSDSEAHYLSISALNGTTAWVVPGNGWLRRTQDGGDSWISLGEPTDYGSEDMKFFNKQQGWILSMTDVLSTSDGGVTWTVRMSRPDEEDFFQAMSFVSPTTGWVGWGSHTIYKTTNGGQTWTELPPAPGRTNALHFVDANVGWRASTLDSGTSGIYRTGDGGNTWEKKYSIDDDLNFWDDMTVVGDRIYVVGGDGGGAFVLRSMDGGETWMYENIGDGGVFLAVSFVDADHGWVAGDGIYRTTDGGETWVKQDAPENLGWNWDIEFVSTTTGWAVGYGGMIVKTTTGGE